MSLPTFAPPVGPSPGTTFKPRIKVLAAEFGDGYSQPTPHGINHIRETLELRWDALTHDQMQAILDFVVARKGTEPFYFRPVGYAAAAKWTCQEWDRSLNEGVWSFRAIFIESFTATA